jgi:hypothetical protein
MQGEIESEAGAGADGGATSAQLPHSAALHHGWRMISSIVMRTAGSSVSIALMRPTHSALTWPGSGSYTPLGGAEGAAVSPRLGVQELWLNHHVAPICQTKVAIAAGTYTSSGRRQLRRGQCVGWRGSNG